MDHHPHVHRGQGYVHASVTGLRHGHRPSHIPLAVGPGQAENMAESGGRPGSPPDPPKGDLPFTPLMGGGD